MPVDWETESCLRDQGLSSASVLQPRRTTSSSNTKWGQVSGAVPLAARRAREAAQYVAEAQERAMQARLHRRQRRNRCKLFLPTLLLLAILLGGGGATIILVLWAQPDGSLPQPWLTSIVLSLALTWFVIEPLMIVRRAGRLADQEGARRVADQNARRAAAQEARDARLTELRNRHLRRVEEGKRAVALAAPGELRTARLPPPVDASGKEMVPNSPSDREGAKAEVLLDTGRNACRPRPALLRSAHAPTASSPVVPHVAASLVGCAATTRILDPKLPPETKAVMEHAVFGIVPKITGAITTIVHMVAAATAIATAMGPTAQAPRAVATTLAKATVTNLVLPFLPTAALS